MPIQDPGGNFIVDIGGGTTEVAVLSLGGIVASRSLRVAGDEFNENIKLFARDKLNLLIGDRMAEDIKLQLGSVLPYGSKPDVAPIRGRDLVTGLPKEVLIDDQQVRDAMAKSVGQIITAIKETLEETPPELIADLMTRGIVLAGGGALLRGLPQLLEQQTATIIHVAEDPLTAVVRGTGIVLEDLDALRPVLMKTEFGK